MDDANGGAPSDLVGRIAAGDSAAEGDFVSRFAPGVRTLVRRHSRPGDPIVDDLTQEVLANVLVRLRAGAIHDVAALPAYIRSAVVHATSAEYRKRRVEDSGAVLETLTSDDSPTTHLAASQLRSLLHDVLAELPVDRDREVLRKFYLEELDRDEVCGRLGIDAQHFHRVVFRARARLRDLLEKAGIVEVPT